MSTLEERQKALNLINGILQEYKMTLTVAIQDAPEAPKQAPEGVEEAKVDKDV